MPDTPVNFDSLGDITKASNDVAGNAVKTAQDLLPALDHATAAIDSINQQFMNTNMNIENQVSKEYDNLLSIRKLQERTSMVPTKLRKLIGIFDSDYSDETQQAKAQGSVVSLQMLKQKQENASLARNIAIDTVNNMTNNQLKKLQAESTTMDLFNKSIETQRSLLSLKGEKEKFSTMHMPDDQLQAAAAADPNNPVLKTEMLRRESQGLQADQLRLAVSDASIRNKNLKEADRIQRLTDDQLTDPTATKGLNPELIKQEQLKRSKETEEDKQRRQQTQANEDALLDKALKDYGANANPEELRRQYDLSTKNGGAITINTRGGTVRVTSQQLLTMIHSNTETMQKYADTQGERATQIAEASSAFDVAQAQLSNLTRVLPAGVPQELQIKIKTYSDAFKAAAAQGSPKAMKEAGDKVQKIIDDFTNETASSFPDKDKGADFIKKVIKTGYGDTSSAAPFLISAAASPSFTRGGVYEEFGPDITDGLLKVVSPSIVGANGTIDRETLLANVAAGGKVQKSSDQITRELLAKKDKDGRTLTNKVGARVLSDYATTILQKIALPNATKAGGSGNPYEAVVDPVTGRISKAMLAPNGGVSFKKVLEELAFQTLQGHKTGTLPVQDDLVDSFLYSLDTGTNKSEWVQGRRQRYNLADYAISALLFNNQEGSIIDQGIRSTIMPIEESARAVAEERMKQAETAAAAAQLITGGPMSSSPNRTALGIQTPTNKNQQAGFPVPISTPVQGQ